MAKDFEITCPHCSKSFSGEDLLKDHIAKAGKEFNKERQILIDEKKKAQVQAKKVEVEADKKRKENEQSISSLASANKILKDTYSFPSSPGIVSVHFQLYMIPSHSSLFPLPHRPHCRPRFLHHNFPLQHLHQDP